MFNPAIHQVIPPMPKRVINADIRRTILAIEAKIKSMPESLGEDCFPLEHSFAEGVYIRKIVMPKGHFIVGKLHRHSYLNVILSGDVSVLTEEGAKRVRGPGYVISPPGTKRFGYTHEETVWLTVHANPDNITDIDILEDLIHAKDFSEIPDCLIEVGENAIYDFSDEIAVIDGESFNIEKFRALTKEVFSKEKDGFWSDWTKEQQDLYMSGDWESFSRSRGYTENEIERLRLWIDVLEEGERLGLSPLDKIRDITTEFALKNIEKDKRGEILLSSHIPSSKKVPYTFQKGDDLCLV